MKKVYCKLSDRYLIPLLFLFFVQQLQGDGFKFRKYAGEFLEIGVAARAQSLGGGCTGLVDDITSCFYNPAGLLHLKNTQVSFMHTQQMIASVNYDFIAIGKPQNENRVFGISIVRLGIDNIKDSRTAQIFFENDPENWRIDWTKVSTFNAADYVLTFSIAQRWIKGWAVGANLKLIKRNLAEYTATGVGIDIGVQKKFGKRLLFGANLKNATSTLISWDTGEKELVKPVLFIGSAYQFYVKKLKGTFSPVIDFILRAENRRESTRSNLGIFSFDLAGGFEYVFLNTIFLRLGMDELSRLNTGVGVQLPHIRFDYAFASYDNEVGNSHRIGLIVDF